ncbi:MAG TPA: hypothetical protein VH251_07330 [Verrucomicrobiae bacterium]|jgi:hypothetical protein|nr:hypothetical protein [Verrucomicrobiae bacterium]
MKQWLALVTLVGTAACFGLASFNAVLDMAMTTFFLVMGLAGLEALRREFAPAKAKV